MATNGLGRALPWTAVAGLAIGLAAPAGALAAIDAHVYLHTAGEAQGRISVVAHVDHPIDAARGVEIVRIAVRSHGRLLAQGSDRFIRSDHQRVHAPHRILLGADATRRVRRAARSGHLHVTVSSRPQRLGAAARAHETPVAAAADTAVVASQDVDLETTSAPPLQAQYASADGKTVVNVTDGQNGAYRIQEMEAATANGEPGTPSSEARVALAAQAIPRTVCDAASCTFGGNVQWAVSAQLSNGQTPIAIQLFADHGIVSWAQATFDAGEGYRVMVAAVPADDPIDLAA